MNCEKCGQKLPTRLSRTSIAFSNAMVTMLFVMFSYFVYLALDANPAVPGLVRTMVWLWMWFCLLVGVAEILVACVYLIMLVVAMLRGGFKECVRPIQSHNGA
jgi:hypothetical protein